MTGLMEYIPGNSILHRMDPRTKLLLPLMICAACFSAGNLAVLSGLLLFDVLLGMAGGILPQTLRLLKGLFKLCLFLFVLQLLFIQHGNVLLPLPFGILITDDGVYTAALVVLRLMGATLPLALLLSLTKMSDLTTALVCKCRVPYPYAFAVSSAIRFVPGFANDLAAIMEAQTARGVEFDTRNPLKKLRLIFPLCIPLLISSVKKIDSSALAAELRGFHLRSKDACFREMRFALPDGLVLLSGCLLIAVGILF